MADLGPVSRFKMASFQMSSQSRHSVRAVSPHRSDFGGEHGVEAGDELGIRSHSASRL
jgi:hypothetical protein